jgi:co-chaperonin GroES (HSP10)
MENVEVNVEVKEVVKKRLDARGLFIVVRPDAKEEKTEGGLFKPVIAQDQETDCRGVVVAAGKGEYMSNGIFRDNEIKVGDRVLFHPAGAMAMMFKLEDKPEKLYVMKEYDVYAFID